MTYCEARTELRFDGFFAGLKPATDEQRYQLDRARELSASIVQTHYLMLRQLWQPIPTALLISVVCWAPRLWRARFIAFSNSASPIWGSSGYRPAGSIR
jgi:hypothetical protein